MLEPHADAKQLSAIELLKMCLESSSEELWAEFVRRLQPAIASSVWRTFHKCTSNKPRRDEVDDMVQQTFLRICSNNSRALRGAKVITEAALFAYVRTIAINITIDLLRRTRRSEPLDEMLPDPSDHRAESSLMLAAVERSLASCAEANPERDPWVFWLYYRDGLTAKSIAEAPGCGLTQKGVESLILRLTRCIRRALMDKKYPEGILRAGSSIKGEDTFGTGT